MSVQYLEPNIVNMIDGSKKFCYTRKQLSLVIGVTLGTLSNLVLDEIIMPISDDEISDKHWRKSLLYDAVESVSNYMNRNIDADKKIELVKILNKIKNFIDTNALIGVKVEN